MVIKKYLWMLVITCIPLLSIGQGEVSSSVEINLIPEAEAFGRFVIPFNTPITIKANTVFDGQRYSKVVLKVYNNTGIKDTRYLIDNNQVEASATWKARNNSDYSMTMNLPILLKKRFYYFNFELYPAIDELDTIRKVYQNMINETQKLLTNKKLLETSVADFEKQIKESPKTKVKGFDINTLEKLKDESKSKIGEIDNNLTLLNSTTKSLLTLKQKYDAYRLDPTDEGLDNLKAEAESFSRLYPNNIVSVVINSSLLKSSKRKNISVYSLAGLTSDMKVLRLAPTAGLGLAYMGPIGKGRGSWIPLNYVGFKWHFSKVLPEMSDPYVYSICSHMYLSFGVASGALQFPTSNDNLIAEGPVGFAGFGSDIAKGFSITGGCIVFNQKPLYSFHRYPRTAVSFVLTLNLSSDILKTTAKTSTKQ